MNFDSVSTELVMLGVHFVEVLKDGHRALYLDSVDWRFVISERDEGVIWEELDTDFSSPIENASVLRDLLATRY